MRALIQRASVCRGGRVTARVVSRGLVATALRIDPPMEGRFREPSTSDGGVILPPWRLAYQPPDYPQREPRDMHDLAAPDSSGPAAHIHLLLRTAGRQATMAAFATFMRQNWTVTSEGTSGQPELFAASATPPETASGLESLGERAAHRAGALHEEALERTGERKRGGAYYTPPDVVEHLLDLCLDPILVERAKRGADAVRAVRVLDPACGSGNFLVAAATRIQRTLQGLGQSPREAARTAFGDCVAGIDIDPTAIELCCSSLAHASRAAASESTLRHHVICADALTISNDEDVLFQSGPLSWRQVLEVTGCRNGYDLVVGNPPFLSQLAADTVRREDYAAGVRRRFGDAVAGLTDSAVLFLLLGAEVVEATSGTVCLIQPISFLSARDAAAARSHLLTVCGLTSLWICEEKLFDASVRVCAPVLVRGESSEHVKLYRTRDFRQVGAAKHSSPQQGTWSALLAASKGVPERVVAAKGTVGDVATATADFRDQYYGLRGCVVDCREADDGELPPLITSGLIDPATLLWGDRKTKFAKSSYECPRVELAKLDERLQSWARDRLRPKLLLATQTKILETAVDDLGRFLPSVPVISITVEDLAYLWMIGAALTSPPVTLVAARRHLGAALSTEALKLSASDLLNLPLPPDVPTWTLAAKHFRRACESTDPRNKRTELTVSAELMCAAYGLAEDHELLDWWLARMPRSRTA